MRILFLLLLILGADETRAAMWLLCDDGGLVVNMYENDVTLILGKYLVTGSLNNDKDTTLIGKYGRFKGMVVPTITANAVAINGSLLVGKESHPINAILQCRKLSEE